MIIGFTGHRDKTVNKGELEKIASQYPGATWVHGGAIGFDSQVEAFARLYDITQLIIFPDYKK